MSTISKYFKVSKKSRPSQPCSSFGSEKVRRWIERMHSYGSSNQHTSESNITEQNDDAGELDWDDVGSIISTSRNSKSQTQRDTSKITTRKRKHNVLQPVNDFVRPLSPPITPKTPKKFTPLVLIDNRKPSQSDCSQDIFNSSIPLPDLNSSFTSVASYQNTPLANVETCFQNISSYLNEISSYCPSEASQPCKTVDQEIQTDFNSSAEVNNSHSNCQPVYSNSLLPKRSFNENSVDPLLAFTDHHLFITLVHDEHVLFATDDDIDKYIDSQMIESRKDFSVEVVALLDYTIAPHQPSSVRMLQKGLNRIISKENFKSHTQYKRASLLNTSDRIKIQIRALFAKLNDDIQNKRRVQIKVPRTTATNTVYEDGILQLARGERKQFSVLKGRTNIVLYLLRKIYGLLMLNTQITQRSIYYQLKSLLPHGKLSQQQVSDGLNIASSMLGTSYSFMNVLSTSKGLVFGDLTLTFGSTAIKCNAQNGTLVPMDLNDLRKVETTAYFILIVEKDTVFQKLLVDDLPNKLSRNFILVTGKGYPDINTRRLLHILWKLLGIPMFMVVDADAYGIDIFLTYKFGSLSHCHMNRELALPKLKWLGVLPSELKDYAAKTLPLKRGDLKKLKSMLTRPYFKSGYNVAICDEINALIQNKKMCEIEGLFESNKFFVEYYLPIKLYKRSFV